MPDIEINPSISRAVVEAGEAFAKSPAMKNVYSTPILGDVVKSASNAFSKLAHSTFSFDTIATGESGAKGRELMKDFKLRQDFHEAQITKANTAAGVEQSRWEIQNAAKRRARPEVMGHNDANAVAFIKAVEKEHGPLKAARLANSMQTMLGDQPFTPTKFTTSPTGKIKAEPMYGMQTGQLRYNVGRNKALSKVLEPYSSSFPTPKPTSDMAREIGKAYSISHATLAPYAVAKHLTQFGGMFSNLSSIDSGLMTLRAMFGEGRENAIKLMTANDAAGEFFTDAEADMHKYKTGQIKDIKILSPEVGQWISKNIATSTPLMRVFRERLVPMAAAQGHFEADKAIQDLIADPKDRAAQVNLQYLGIRDWQGAVQRYVANGNKIHTDDARTAITTNVFQRAFHNNEAYRSRFALTPYGRFLTTYHWIGQNIKRYVQREIMRAIYSRNPMQIATTMATLGIAIPGATYGIHKVLDLMRGVPQPTPEEHAKRFFRNSNLIADMSGWGVEWGLINSAVHRETLDHLAGGQVSRVIKTGEDAVAGVVGKAEGQKHAMWPLWRDLFEELPYGVGNRFAHSLFPTRAEIQAKKPMTARRLAAQRAAQRRKMMGR